MGQPQPNPHGDLHHRLYGYFGETIEEMEIAGIPAVIQGVQGNLHLIHYVDYKATWDEWVGQGACGSTNNDLGLKVLALARQLGHEHVKLTFGISAAHRVVGSGDP